MSEKYNPKYDYKLKVKLCSLWENKAYHKDMFPQYSGPLGDGMLLVQENKYAKDEKHPKFIVYFVPKLKAEKQESVDALKDEFSTPPPLFDEGLPF